MSAPDADLVIAGAGPAGLGVAIEAAARGLRVIVVERAELPADKACGEGLLPPAALRLRELGVELPGWGCHPIRGLRYVDGPLAASADFVEGCGVGVRRLALSEGLVARARRAGVELRTGCRARGLAQAGSEVRLETSSGTVRASWLVAADGLHSRVRELAGVVTRRGPRRFGLRRHFRIAPWSPYVEVHWAEGVEAYVTPAGPELVGVAFLWSDGSGDHEAFLQRFPELRERLGAPATAPRGAGPFAAMAARRVRGRVLLVGDAAGYLDALSGEGVGLALEGARALVEALCAGRPERYEASWRRLMRRHLVVTHALLALSRRPGARRRVMRSLADRPAPLATLLAFATGARGYGRALPALGRLCLALLAG